LADKKFSFFLSLISVRRVAENAWKPAKLQATIHAQATRQR
jgi:hypothetical protein